MQSRRGDHPELIISSESRGDEWVWLCGGCVRLVAQEVDVETGRRDWLQQPEVWAFVRGRIEERRAKVSEPRAAANHQDGRVPLSPEGK